MSKPPTKCAAAPDLAALQTELRVTREVLAAIQKTADTFKARVKVLRDKVAKAKAKGSKP